MGKGRYDGAPELRNVHVVTDLGLFELSASLYVQLCACVRACASVCTCECVRVRVCARASVCTPVCVMLCNVELCFPTLLDSIIMINLQVVK